MKLCRQDLSCHTLAEGDCSKLLSDTFHIELALSGMLVNPGMNFILCLNAKAWSLDTFDKNIQGCTHV